MAATIIAKFFNQKDPVRCTEKASLGRLFEHCARAYCRRKKWKIVDTNLTRKFGEIDILAENSGGDLILIEVRGLQNSRYRAARTLSKAKIQRLAKMAQWVSRRWRKPVRMEFLEVTGVVKARGLPRFFQLWIAAWYPEILGLRLSALGIY